MVEATRLVAARRLARRLLPRRRSTRGVNVVGYLDATSGLGERARELVATLRAGGVAVSEWSIPAEPPADTSVTASASASASAAISDAAGGPVYDTTIAMVTAVQLADVRKRVPRPFDEAARTIGYFFWELAEVPDEQRWGIGLVDEIWVPTSFVAGAYRSATTTPVRHQPLPLPRPSASIDAGERMTFDVLVGFDFLSVMERKNPIGAMDAFRRAFSDDDPVRLTIKTLNGARRPEQLARLQALADGDERIMIRDGYMSHDELVELTASADVLLSLHRSEGLGLHLAEAMALGTLVVASRYGGSLDLMDDDSAGLVDVELIEVSDGEGAYSPPARWADPDIGQASILLRRAFEDPDWRREVTEQARQRIAASPTRAEIGANLASVLW